jgi:hypothetical protein
MIAGVITATLLGPVLAVPVDSELLLLVDTSIFVTPRNFNDTLESFARSFEDPNLVDTLRSGPEGGIAASLALFSGPNSQAVTVPWMSINDASSAQAFADAVRASARPFADFTTSFVEAFGFATEQFGSETGAPGNGFESNTQVVNIMSESFLLPSETAPAVQAASSQTILRGVDVINAMVVGTFNSTAANDYYANNIIGGSVGGEPGTVNSSANYRVLPAQTLAALDRQLSVAVPEMGTSACAIAGLLFLARRRRA